MTVNTNETRKTYNGNAVTTAFATPQFLADEDLAVYVDGVLQTLTTHYTVAGAGVPAGGTVTFVTAPPAGTANVVIIRDPPLTQLLDLVENDANPAATRETAFDKLTMIAQRLADRISRVVRLSDTDTSASIELPVAADRASKYLAFDAAGDVMVSAGAAGAYPVTAFVGTILDDATAANVLTTLGVSAFVQTTLDDADAGAFKDTLLVGASVTHDFTSDANYTLTATQEQYDRIVLTDSTVVLTAGRDVVCSTAQRSRTYQNDTAQTLTVKTAAGTGIAVAAGTSRPLVCDGTNVIDPMTAFTVPTDLTSKIQPITASVGSNALTITLNPTTLDFRSGTLGSGTVNTREVSAAISVVVSSGSTLGTGSGRASRLAVLAIDNAGTVELAVVNTSGGTNLDETTLISTTAEGGAGAADSETTIYSTTARTNVPFRVVGFVESTQATAGTWATAPSTIQGAGGIAVAAMNSLGYGQTWQDVSASRAQSTTYYNTTGRPIFVIISLGLGTNSVVSLTLSPLTSKTILSQNFNAAYGNALWFPVAPGGSYYVSGASSVTEWLELR